MEGADSLQMCELIDPVGPPAPPTEVTATPKKERKELFQVNTHPGAKISTSNKRDRRLKKIVMRVVEFCKKEHEEGQQIPFRFFKKRASLMTGVSLSTIHRIETIDMKESSPEPGSKPKSKKDGEKKKKKKKTTGGTTTAHTQEESMSPAKKKRARKVKAGDKDRPGANDTHTVIVHNSDNNFTASNINNTIASVNSNNIPLAVTLAQMPKGDLISMQPPQHSFAVAQPGGVTTVVTTININNQGGQDRGGGCGGWGTATPVGPFAMGDVRGDGTVGVGVGAPHATFAGQLDPNAWHSSLGTAAAFAGGVQGATALVGHQIVQAYSTNPTAPTVTLSHPQHDRNSPVFLQF